MRFGRQGATAWGKILKKTAPAVGWFSSYRTIARR